MISAVDTNVLLDILRPNPAFAERSAALIDRCGREGPLCLCEIVHAELSAHFGKYEDLDRFLGEVGIQGFYLSKPLPASRLSHLLLTRGSGVDRWLSAPGRVSESPGPARALRVLRS